MGSFSQNKWREMKTVLHKINALPPCQWPSCGHLRNRSPPIATLALILLLLLLLPPPPPPLLLLILPWLLHLPDDNNDGIKFRYQ